MDESGDQGNNGPFKFMIDMVQYIELEETIWGMKLVGVVVVTELRITTEWINVSVQVLVRCGKNKQTGGESGFPQGIRRRNRGVKLTVNTNARLQPSTHTKTEAHNQSTTSVVSRS
jgi:hypothetical protein